MRTGFTGVSRLLKRIIERPYGAEHPLYHDPGRRYALAWATVVLALRAALQFQ